MATHRPRVPRSAAAERTQEVGATLAGAPKSSAEKASSSRQQQMVPAPRPPSRAEQSTSGQSTTATPRQSEGQGANRRSSNTQTSSKQSAGKQQARLVHQDSRSVQRPAQRAKTHSERPRQTGQSTQSGTSAQTGRSARAGAPTQSKLPTQSKPSTQSKWPSQTRPKPGRPRTKRPASLLQNRPSRPPQGRGHTPVPARTFSGRVLILVMVAIVVVVMVTPTIRVFMQQRRDVAEAKAQIVEQQAQEQSLKDEIERWGDNAYVLQQARSQLNMVMPGERQYIVTDTGKQADKPIPERFDGPTDLPWADAFWESVKRAASKP